MLPVMFHVQINNSSNMYISEGFATLCLSLYLFLQSEKIVLTFG